MSFTINQNRDFADDMINRDGLLDTAIDYITTNLDVEDVFESHFLCEYVGENYEPEDVFDKEKLAEWAEHNGHVKP